MRSVRRSRDVPGLWQKAASETRTSRDSLLRRTWAYLSGSSMYPIIMPRLWITASLTMSALSSASICCSMDKTRELRISFCRDRNKRRSELFFPLHSFHFILLFSFRALECVLTGRYGAKAPQDSATSNLRSGYLWLIFRGREKKRLQRGKEREC